MFRYPGGKLRLMKKINLNLKKSLSSLNVNEIKKIHIGDVFVGGGGSLINMAKDFPNAKFSINDKNFNVYTFWKFFCNINENELENFLNKLKKTKPSLSLYEEIFYSKPDNDFDIAFKTFFLNKTSYNGYITNYLPIGGKNQTGKWKVDCYWNYKTFRKNFETTFNLLKNRIIKIENNNFSDFLLNNEFDFIYADPPYIKYGTQWYGIDFTLDDFFYLVDCLEQSSKEFAISIDNNINIINKYKNKYKILDMYLKYTSKSSYNIKIENSKELLIIKNIYE